MLRTIAAEPREDFGKNSARRLRHAGRIPAVVYGGGGQAIPVTVDPKVVHQILYSETGHNTLFTLEITGRTPARVMVRDWQVEPVRGDLLHVDMVRVAADARLRLKVPVHLTGDAFGVKTEGGILEFILREVEIECLPDNIPEHIVVDITSFKIGKHLRAGELPLGERAKLLTDPTRVIAVVAALKAEEEKAGEEVVAAEPAEPELIRKAKAEEADEGEAAEEKPAKPEKKAEKKEGK
jgi:large subunit ribosomal protein L25